MLSFSDQAIKIDSENRKSITILVICENLSPIYRMVSDKLSLKNSKINKECLGSLTFLPPSNFAVFDGCYSFVTNWKELSTNGSN